MIKNNADWKNTDGAKKFASPKSVLQYKYAMV